MKFFCRKSQKKYHFKKGHSFDKLRNENLPFEFHFNRVLLKMHRINLKD